MKNILHITVLSILMISQSAYAQNSISGSVSDENNLPIPGVSIIEKGTSNGTSSDFDGNFTIQVEPGASLIFSSVGFTSQEILVVQDQEIIVNLSSDIMGLDEVIVTTGYGNQKKRSITGSIVTLSSENIVSRGVQNLTHALAGSIAGVSTQQPIGLIGQDDAKVYIRGKGTLGNTDALIVIDGIPDRGSISRLNADDIESITVLKDASAAIYGARAANGVLLITTKRGKFNKETKFNLNTSYTINSPTVRTKALDSWKWASYQKEQIDNLSLGWATVFNDEQIGFLRDGSRPDEYANTDWFEETIAKSKPSSNLSLNVEGGSETISYFVSGQYSKQEQMFNGDFPFEQYQFRSNIDIKLTDKLSMGFDVLNRRDDGQYTKSDTFDGVGYNTEEVWDQLYGGAAGYTQGWPWLVGRLSNGQIGKGAQPSGGSNPIGILANGSNRLINDVLNTKLSFAYNISEDLKVTAYAAFDKSNRSQKKFTAVFDEYLFNGTTGEFTKAIDGIKPILNQKKQNNSNNLFNIKLDYEKSFGNHNIDAFVAYEQSKTRMDFIMVERGGFGGNAIPEIFAGNASTAQTDGRSMAAGRQNMFGRINYDFDGTYLATVSLRRDGSQNFPTDNRFGFFPAISAGWIISNESFVKNISSIDFLKLRASWGKMGNDNILPFQYLSSYEFTDYSAFGYGVQVGYDFGDGERPGFYESTIANPNVTWETATTQNIAVEGRLFNNAVSFEFDYFTSKREGILIKRSASFPEFTGILLPDENLGIVENKGFELQLGYKNDINNNLSFSINGNISQSKNKVVFLDEAISTTVWQKYEGRSIDSFYGYQSNDLYRTVSQITADGYTLSDPQNRGFDVVWDKWFNQGAIRLVDKNGDNNITEADRSRSDKSLVPTTFYGINLAISYKNFELSTLIQGQAGGYYNDNNFAVNHALYDDAWSPTNTDAAYPIPTPTYVIGAFTYQSDFYLTKSDYARIKNLSLNYVVDGNILEALNVDNLNVFLRGNNVAILKSPNSNIDPEGVMGAFLIKSWQLGINLTF